MTEEEQKVIENIEKELNKKYEVVPLYKDFSINSPMNIVQKHYNDTDIKIILNLISKQQEIIKNQSYTNKKMRNKIKTVRKERNKLKANIEKIQDYCRKTLAFERKLKRDKTTPDLFNQGRFATCDDILKI